LTHRDLLEGHIIRAAVREPQSWPIHRLAEERMLRSAESAPRPRHPPSAWERECKALGERVLELLILGAAAVPLLPAGVQVELRVRVTAIAHARLRASGVPWPIPGRGTPLPRFPATASWPWRRFGQRPHSAAQTQPNRAYAGHGGARTDVPGLADVVVEPRPRALDLRGMGARCSKGSTPRSMRGAMSIEFQQGRARSTQTQSASMKRISTGIAASVPPLRRMIASSVAGAMLLGCGGSAAGGSPNSALQVAPRSGVLTGVILFVGGPAPASGRRPAAGWIHVYGPHGNTVAVVHVREHHYFRIALSAGTFSVIATQTRRGTSLGCAAQRVRVHADRETHVMVSLGCLVP
jgi:hypothetical protein